MRIKVAECVKSEAQEYCYPVCPGFVFVQLLFDVVSEVSVTLPFPKQLYRGFRRFWRGFGLVKWRFLEEGAEDSKGFLKVPGKFRTRRCHCRI